MSSDDNLCKVEAGKDNVSLNTRPRSVLNQVSTEELSKANLKKSSTWQPEVYGCPTSLVYNHLPKEKTKTICPIVRTDNLLEDTGIF